MQYRIFYIELQLLINPRSFQETIVYYKLNLLESTRKSSITIDKLIKEFDLFLAREEKFVLLAYHNFARYF